MTVENNPELNKKGHKGLFLRLFLTLFLPVAIVAAIFAGIFYANELRSINLFMNERERNSIELIGEHLESIFETLRSDIMVVAGHSAMEGVFQGEARAIAELKEEFSLFAFKKELYDQIRYIDETGMERIRVNHRNRIIHVIADEELQDKSGRYYFKMGMRLPPEGVYYSALDLNVEHGKIEKPHRPVLRVATPVYDNEAVKRGLLVLNYSAFDVMHHIEDHGNRNGSSLMLVSPDGYWLIGGDEGDNFAFLFKGKEDHRFANRYPLAWEKMKKDVEGRFVNSEGMFTFSTFDLSSGRYRESAFNTDVHDHSTADSSGKVIFNDPGLLSESRAAGDRNWKVISYMSPELHRASAKGLRIKLMLVYLGVMLVAAIVSWVYAVARLRRTVAEDTLVNSERRFQAMMDNSSAVISVKDIDGSYQFVNKAFEKVFQLKSEDVVGSTDHDVFSVERADAFRSNDLRAINKGGPLELEAVIEQRDGLHTYIVLKFPLLDSKGEPYAVCGISTDITARKEVEDELRKSRQKIALHFDQTPLAVIEWNTAFEVVGWNPAAEQIFGYTAMEAIGHHAAGLIVSESFRAQIDIVWQKLMANRGGRRSTNENITRDGKVIICEWYNTPLVDSMGEVIGVSSLVMDITERKQTELALETLYKTTGGRLGQEFFDGVVESLSEWLDADCVIVGEKYDGENIRALSMKFDGKKVDDFSYALPGTPCGEVVCGENMCIYHEDVAGLFPYDEVLTDMGAVGYVGTILQGKDGTPIGVLCALTRRKLVLPPDGEEVLKLVASRTSAELERMRAEQEVLKVNRSLKVISECNEALVHASDEGALLNDICRIIINTGGYRMVWVGYAEDDAQKSVRPVAKAGLDAGYVDNLNISWGDSEHGQGPTGKAIRTGVFSVARNLASDPIFEVWREEAAKRGYASSIALPLMHNEVVLGALNIYAGEADAFSDEETALLMELAKDLAYGIVTLRAHIERRKAEDAATHLGRILEESLNEIYIFDAESFRFLQVNKGARGNIGYTMEELRELTPIDIKPQISSDEFNVLVEPLRSGEREFIQFRTVHERKDGSIYPVDVSMQLSSFDERPVFVAIILDITEREKAEREVQRLTSSLERQVDERTAELQAVNKELEAFAYSVSHDLRAPLRGIDGFSQALIEDYGANLDDDAKSYLVRIRSATQHMGELIKDMLLLSRVTRNELRRETVDVSGIALQIGDALMKASQGHSVEFVVEPELTAKDVDSHMLRVVLENLIGNAWKFTAKKDNVKIEVGGFQKQKDGEQVFFVRDNGAGFDMAYAGKLFGAFQRLHSVDEFEGTGIGLATVQRIVHRHGGRIWAEGEVGKGAVFYFTLGQSAG